MIGSLIAFSGVVASFPILRYVLGLKHWKNYTVVAIGFSLYLFLLPFGAKWQIGLLSWLLVTLSLVAIMGALRKKFYHRNLHFFSKLALTVQIGLAVYLLEVWALSRLVGIDLLTWFSIGWAGVLLLTGLETLGWLFLKRTSVEAWRRMVVSLLFAIGVGIIFRFKTLLVFLYMHQEILIFFWAVTIIISTWKHINISDFVRFRKILNKSE